ncbi:MAG: S1C family serine protease [Vampirovibrionales bacterium]
MLQSSRISLLVSFLALVVSITNASWWQALWQATPQTSSPPALQHPTTPQKDRRALPSVAQAGFADSISSVAALLAPSVVNIDVTVQKQAPSPVFEGSDLFRYFFGDGMMSSPEQQYKQQGQGSGVVYQAEKGYIITNHHVVGGASEIVVTFNNHTKLPARLIGSDPLTDLAVIQVSPKPNTHLTAAPLAEESSIRPGDWAIAIGSPLGFDHSVTLGIVSALSRSVPDLNKEVAFIQTDTAINPGNSGGPLVNLSGQVMGINTAISGRAQNIGFAIPSDTVKHVVESLIKEGSVKRAYVGVHLTELNDELRDTLGVEKNTEGVVIAQVQPDSPAEQAGLKQGDIIQRVNGTVVRSAEDVQRLARSQPIGSRFKVLLLRQGSLVACTLSSKPLTPST